ncbi:hypothetical protein C8Q78DRAFT_961205 [Trametes maxima]|nr:hypothetical protein C8Q78DRAFT_961205 [Trametes maxima]
MSDFKSKEQMASKRLCPTTPALGSRYVNKKRSKPGNVIIRPGQFSFAGETEPQYLPQRWSFHVQPEGQPYFASDSSPRFVTDAYIYSSDVQQRILHFASLLQEVCEAAQITLPQSAEVYLCPSSEAEDECWYYIADHASHTVSWLEEVDLDELRIQDVMSESHLRLALEDLYWQHIEQFPSHRLDSLSLCVDDLIAIFIHGEGDQMTSENSTFPYVAKECKQFVRILEAAKQKLDQPPSVCVVARLWSTISRHRMQTHYAQEHARLSRDQLILDLPEVPRSRVFSAASCLLFGIPQRYSEQLDRLFSDEIVFVHPWRDFAQRARSEWQQYLSWSLALSIFNVLMLSVSPASRLIAGLSLACCSIALISGLALLLQYNDAPRWCADQAFSFCCTAQEKSPGFRRTALAFSAPRAAFIWAAGIASLQTLVWLQRAAGMQALGALAGLMLLASLPWARWVRSARRQWHARREQSEEGVMSV